MSGVKGRSGRRQKGAKQRQVDGSKTRKHHHKQPKQVEGEPVMPDWLSAEEREWWSYYATLLKGQQRLTVDAGPWLISAASATADFMSWREESAHAPLVITSEAGDKAHPARIQLRLSRLAWVRVLTEAGLTPASVSRVVMPSDEKDAADDFTTFQAARSAIRRVK